MSGGSPCNFAFIPIDQRIPMIPKKWSNKHGLIHIGVVYADLQEHFGDESDIELGATIALGVAHLPAEAFALDGGHAQYVELGQRAHHRIQPIRFDDGFNHLHEEASFFRIPYWHFHLACELGPSCRANTHCPKSTRIQPEKPCCCAASASLSKDYAR